MEINTSVSRHGQTVRRSLPDASDASTRAFTLQSQTDANRSRPLRTHPDVVSVRVGVNSAPELDFLANSKSNSGIGIELELALPSPGGIGIELELPSFELELESELRSSELNSELLSWN